MIIKRTFNIGELLDDDPKYLFNNYVKIVEVDKEKSDKFRLTRHRAKYTFSKIEHLPDPIAALRQCFQESINKAIEESKKNNIVPNKIGLTISSANLNPDFQVSFTEITENTVDAIFNRFRIIQEQYPDRSLHSQPFDVEVTLINSKTLPTEKQTSGSGRGIRDHFRHQIDEKKLIKIENDGDNYCLFYALIIMRIYLKDYLGERKLKQQAFDKLSKNSNRIRILVDFCHAESRGAFLHRTEIDRMCVRSAGLFCGHFQFLAVRIHRLLNPTMVAFSDRSFIQIPVGPSFHSGPFSFFFCFLLSPHPFIGGNGPNKEAHFSSKRE
jgi:hypothetical protein